MSSATFSLPADDPQKMSLFQISFHEEESDELVAGSFLDTWGERDVLFFFNVMSLCVLAM